MAPMDPSTTSLAEFLLRLLVAFGLGASGALLTAIGYATPVTGLLLVASLGLVARSAGAGADRPIRTEG